MLRLILFIIILLVMGAGLSRLAEIPGEVTLLWMGWEFKTSGLFLLFLFGFFVILSIALYQVISGLFTAPKRYLKLRRAEHHERGISVLTEAFAAIAVSDIANARKLTKKADKLLGNPPITRLLSAQLAKVEGRDDVAEQELKGLLQHKETRFLAARNLLEQAKKSGDTEQALAYAEQAETLRPDSSYATLALIDLYTAEQSWQKAEDVIRKAKKHGALNGEEANRYSAIIHYQHALNLFEREDFDTALTYAKHAHKALPDMVPATLLLARVYARLGQKPQAARAVFRTWKLFPHPSLANLYRKLYQEESSAKRLKRIEKLASNQPDSIESQIAIAEAAIEAKDYSKARNRLKIALSKQETPRICKLMARLEEAENKSRENADMWIERAVRANVGPSWTCEECQAIPDKWTLHCPECGAFDSISWRVNRLNFVESHKSRLPA